MNQQAKSKYQWAPVSPERPPYIQDIPPEEGFSLPKIIAFISTTLGGLLGLLIAQFLHIFSLILEGKYIVTKAGDLGLIDFLGLSNRWLTTGNSSNRNTWTEGLSNFFKPWTFLPEPGVAKDWDNDVEFGRQRLNGINPGVIKKCKPEDIAPESHFPVRNEVSKLGYDVELALAENRLYLLDYRLLDRLITPQLENQIGKPLIAPLCLLYVNEKKQLIPIAIQLRPKIDENTPLIFTPNSSYWQWLAAKVAVSCADITYQGVIAHLLKAHLVSEVFALCTHRNLSSNHILYQLLKPHFFNTFTINMMGRQVFLGYGGLFNTVGSLGYSGSNEILSRAYTGQGLGVIKDFQYQGKPWEFYTQAVPYDLASRQVEDLPFYYYRDDAKLIWDAVKKYVNNVLKGHYKNSEDLVNDQELQAWKDELISPNGGRIKGLLPPEKSEQLSGKFSNIDDLIELVTNIIFTATAHHASVNFGQYEFGAWVPNMPFAIYGTFQNLQQIDSEEKFVKILPNRLQTIVQITLLNVLSLTPPDTSKTLLTLDNPFQDSANQQAFKDFQQQLQLIEQEIVARNAPLEKPYIYLQPSRIPQSVAI